MRHSDSLHTRPQLTHQAPSSSVHVRVSPKVEEMQQARGGTKSKLLSNNIKLEERDEEQEEQEEEKLAPKKQQLPWATIKVPRNVYNFLTAKPKKETVAPMMWVPAPPFPWSVMSAWIGPMNYFPIMKS